MKINWDKIHKNLTPEIKEYLLLEEKQILSCINSQDAVLNVGCGYGRILNLLKTNCVKIIGIDISEDCVKKCKKKFKNSRNTSVSKIDISNTNFESNYFDKIILDFNFLGNISKSQREKSLEEIRRILKPKGKILGSVYSEKSLEQQLRLYENLGFNIFSFNKNYVNYKVGRSIFKIKRFEKTEIKNLLEKFFKNVKLFNLTKFVYFFIGEK
jgi:2-polyprenyl-6-hydroxyphenyl methylase/3-demethylubiquinone-9 3-methyltransferase